jgi:hypothetical protein
MKKPKIKFKVIKEDLGYSATANVGDKFIGTQGDTFEELKEMILDALNLSFEDEGFVYSIDEIALEYDMGSFFAFYSVIDTSALSKRTGVKQGLLLQYINGNRKPSREQTKKILRGVQQISRELSEVSLF